MKTAIASLFTALTPNEFSHSSGFARIFSEQLAASGVPHDMLYSADANSRVTPWNDYDTIYLYQGLDLNGKLGMNLFGGACEGNAQILRRLINFTGKLFCIGYPLLPYHELAKRDWNGLISKREFEILESWQHRATVIANPTATKALAIGDSHIPSVWRAWDHIDVRSGMTLHGALKLGLRTLIAKRYSRVTLYFGQIDVRHHLCRQPRPLSAARELVNHYVQQAKDLVDSGMRVELCELHPIESEDRPIPGPGCYKGTPFFGTWEDRDACRQAINGILRSYAPKFGFEFFKSHPMFKLPSGEMDQKYMERPRSVHIAPKYYRAFRG